MAYPNYPDYSNRNLDPKSPLKGLYKSDYDFINFKYPSDLGADNRGHWINFFINVHNNTKYTKSSKSSNIVGTAQSNATSDDRITSPNYTIPGKTFGGTIPLTDTKFTLDTPSLSLGRQTKRIVSSISLFMPDTVNVNYSSDWQQTSLTDALGPIMAIGQLGKSAADSKNLIEALRTISSAGPLAELASTLSGELGKNIGLSPDAGGVFFHAAGVAINPQLEVLFKQVALREFQFDFLFYDS